MTYPTLTMAYEVIKRVGGRAYRYRVESFRDPETRRVRGKWTYLGRVEGDVATLDRPARVPSRERLLDAAIRLLETDEVDRITSAAVAREAGVAYGTFYRAFRDLGHLVREALLRAPDAVAVREALSAPIGSVADERVRLLAWVEAVVERVAAQPGLHRAWLVVSNRDPEVIAERQARVARTIDDVRAYLERLTEAGVASVEATSFTAYAIVALLHSIARERAFDAERIDTRTRDGVGRIIAELAGL